MRAMALDVGAKTVGVALSDELGITAQPHDTVRRTNFKADLAALIQIMKEYEVSQVVVGLPMNMNGTEGPSAQEARRVGEAIAQATGVKVIYWDERMTTVAAERVLLEGDVSRGKRKQVIDKLAAALILQGWLASRPGQADGDFE